MGIIIVHPFIFSSYIQSIQFDREGLNNVRTYMSVEFGKYIFKKNAEINIKKYVSYHIHCCTIYPALGSTEGKHVIQSFVHLILIWTLKHVGSIVGDVRKAVFFQTTIQLSRLILNLHTFKY